MWSEEFHHSFAPPDEVLALVASGALDDDSWGNDVSPSFRTSSRVLWCDHPDPQRREWTEQARFHVFALDDKGEALYDTPLYEGDSVTLALAATVPR